MVAAHPAWVKTASLLASSAGLMHDIGKFGQAFQEKLHSKIPKADDVRHEWLSMMVVKKLFNGQSWADSWLDMNRYRDKSPFDRHLHNAFDVLLFLIATHHRMPASQSEKTQGGSFNPRISNKKHVRNDEHIPIPVSEPDKKTMTLILSRLEKIKNRLTDSESSHELYWRAIALLSRMALILADQSVSAEKMNHQEARAYANTDRKTKTMNQNLDWHLQNVGHVAGNMVFHLLSLTPPSLSQDSIERICQKSTGRYEWQDRSSRLLFSSANQNDCPHLVFNMASTGSGKTRMNIRALCELSHSKPVRVATALNLRTLTLQTSDAYLDQIGIHKDELACVIGDRLTKTLHEFKKQDNKNNEEFEDDDENPMLDDFATISDFEYTEAPVWLKKFINQKPDSEKVIGAPVMVSTIDFLIAAGEPHRQAHHVLAVMRLMTSDLILDEIDGYDPKSLLAVLRLVLMSAFFGKNVVVSSGTLSKPVAQAVWKVYQRGIEMRAALNNTTPDFVTVAIDDQTNPSTLKTNDFLCFDRFYCAKIDQIMVLLRQGYCYRMPFLMPIEQKDKAGFMAAIKNAVIQLHQNHHLHDPVTGKRISFGLVRMANINPAVHVAQFLSNELKNAKIACYHSQHFPLLRFHLERRLDALLTRKEGDNHLLTDHEVRKAIDTTDCDDILMIVVATPVEEIGRDHDFDWAVIEPSSTQSIVQTAGRVNRHRLMPVDRPNIALLQFNLRHITNKSDQKPVFEKPGLESWDHLYDTHDLAQLFNWDILQHKLDASARFGEHQFAKLDDRNMSCAIKKWFDYILGDGKDGHLWMCQDVYERTPLRNIQPRMDIILKSEDLSNPNKMYIREYNKKEESRRFDVKKEINNGWLYLNDEALLALADDAGVRAEDGFTVSVFSESGQQDGRGYSEYTRHCSFGFFKPKD